jgi:hypothetical protein|tara:strand:+ start:317 stop:754 length:438 start_codon:yes stop_codon:yes gene_type:complete
MARAYSTEDTNLSKSLISSRGTDYKDIDLAFAAKPAGDVFKKTDAAAVKQAVKNLLLTNRGEKPFQPDFGADLNEVLFNLDTEFDPDFVQDLIAEAIKNFEPRALVLSVSVSTDGDNNRLDATVEFQVVNTEEIVTTEVSLARLR